jgi:hypothetical protein
LSDAIPSCKIDGGVDNCNTD